MYKSARFFVAAQRNPSLYPLRPTPAVGKSRQCAYFSPSWTAFQADRGRDFSVIVDGISN
jgi:hypothetical protein